MNPFLKLLTILLMLDDAPEAQRRWRQLVSIMVAVFALHILWSCGWGAKVGLSSGFAQVTDIVEIKAQLALAADVATAVKIRLLKKSIIDTRILQCNADSKRYYTQRLEELTDEYFQDTKAIFSVPDCGDLR